MCSPVRRVLGASQLVFTRAPQSGATFDLHNAGIHANMVWFEYWHSAGFLAVAVHLTTVQINSIADAARTMRARPSGNAVRQQPLISPS